MMAKGEYGSNPIVIDDSGDEIPGAVLSFPADGPGPGIQEGGFMAGEITNAVDLPVLSAWPSRVYCDCCGEARDYFVEPMTTDDLNDTPWGDMVCKTCHFVIATFSEPK